MLPLVALALSSTPVPLTCEQLWPEVWARFATVETAATPFFRRFPHGQALLVQKWVLECEAFDAGTLACARRETLERELAELRQTLEREKMPPAERDTLITRLRSEWSILDCKEVTRALDRAAERAARQLAVGATDVLTPNTIPALSDDSASPVMPLPVPFPFFGSLVTHAGVQSNGMVQLFTSSSGTVSTSYMNTSIPSTSAPDGFAAPLWNDLFPDGTSAIRMRAFTAGGARLTVNWLNVAGPNTEFQAKFFTTGVIEFHYCSMAGVATSSATAGVESLSGFSGTEGTFSTTLSGSGMRFTP